MIVVRDLAGLGEWTAASALYRSVFGYEHPEFGISPRLLAALRENAGTVIGAFDEAGELVGFCYGFCAVEDGELYHYSQAAAVAPGLQGAGVGRKLKQAQAEAARGTGARTMRWTFDPYALRNAHFNFAILGATAIRFLPDYYDDGDSDRLLVSWDLYKPYAIKSEFSVITAPATDRYAAPGAEDRGLLRAKIKSEFASGKRLVGVERQHTADQVGYMFVRDAQ
ncbi:GNAT family N-acetyltransferase [Paractinoplanes atraurantiacus]|uniref:Predicted acetyltransferase, GNAT superfamily n=1 Tax=Paractinoplanes atraurantiacus TaxID=1036182 RepID=A0A285J060_9ACTN|nr:GNAT family N-acetyltransferase [Actinoplanes atraurantiacus]SNY53287.1 Predicted acetyltransferase, GNAT superfamily [Actinoplanes atraurantiacus]